MRVLLMMLTLLVACGDKDDTGLPPVDGDGDGYSVLDDCDDAEVAINPGAEELCDGIDNNCDGDEDDAADALTWYADGDGDGYGDASSTTAACSQPSGYVADVTDCDDSDANANPSASEYCDGHDDDCDGDVDEDSALDAAVSYADTDGDGFGDSSDCGDCAVSCTPPSGYVHDDRDWDDTDAELPGLDCTLLVPGDSTTIQGAIDLSFSADVVCVAADTYYENVDFGGMDITLRGAEGRDATIIDGGAAGPVVSFTSGEGMDSVLESFTLTNGYASHGGGVYIDGASPSLEDLLIEGNESTNVGGGVAVQLGEPVMQRLHIRGNIAAGSGGGLWTNSEEYLLADSIVADNEAQYGGGLYLSSPSGSSSAALIERVRVEGNHASTSSLFGGGLMAANNRVLLSNCAFTGNTGANGAGVGLYASDADFENVAIVGNVTSHSAGGSMPGWARSPRSPTA